VSKKLPGIRLVPVELEVGGQTTTETHEAVFSNSSRPGLRGTRQTRARRQYEFSISSPSFQFQRLDQGNGKTDGEAVAPFGDLP